MIKEQSTWTPEKIKMLKKLWSKGKSTVEIGRELGISKNAVVGKVHRLELNARPSPIKKEVAVKPIKQKAKVPASGKMTLMDLKLNSCRWPIGEPKDADFHFCGKDTVTGKPYCPEHCKVAYTSLKELANQNKKDGSDDVNTKKNTTDDMDDDEEDVIVEVLDIKKMPKEEVIKTPAKKDMPKKSEPKKEVKVQKTVSVKTTVKQPEKKKAEVTPKTVKASAQKMSTQKAVKKASEKKDIKKEPIKTAKKEAAEKKGVTSAFKKVVAKLSHKGKGK